MPRKSAASLAVVRVGPKPLKARLAPPAGMPERQAEHWVRITGALPADWFSPEQAPLLTRLCVHTTRCEDIEHAMAGLDPLADLEEYRKLAAVASAETSRLLALSRSLRLTLTARMEHDTAATKAAKGGAAAGVDALLGVGR
jgi:hypothetical protein